MQKTEKSFQKFQMKTSNDTLFFSMRFLVIEFQHVGVLQVISKMMLIELKLNNTHPLCIMQTCQNLRFKHLTMR